MTNHIRLGIAACLIVVLAGCGRSTDRCTISGAVSLAGEPVDGGHIQFAPVAADQTSASGAMINAGRYSVPAESGLLPGKYRVRVYWPEKIVFKPGPNPLPKERMPAKYNVQSELTVEVRQGGANTFDFAMEP